MVIAQPYLSLTTTEPYRCTQQAKPQQLATLAKTLAVARAASHGAPKTHFTLFPEYSIPGLDGIAFVHAAISAPDWQNGTIVIGGADALSKPDFATLAGAPNTYLEVNHNSIGRMAQDEWVNCAITWVKSAGGKVERWLQPKLFPAWPEQDVPYQDMFRGNSVFAFNGQFENGTQYRFCSLVCFDWIATLDGQKAWRFVMDHLGQQAAQVQAEVPFSWCFVIQCNRKPSSDSFLTEVTPFFDQTTFPNVRRDRACLVFANSAGKPAPGRADLYGSTSLVFSRQTLFKDPKCHATFCNGGARFRSSTLLTAYRDVLFRERGACIHSFIQVNPSSLNAGAAGKAIAVENAFVFSLGGPADPRTPSAPVPASVKWLNDELDELGSLSADYPAVPLAVLAGGTHTHTVAALRVISPESATHAVKLAAQGSTADDADEWDRGEAEALQHLVDTLDIIGLAFGPAVVGADPAHATVEINNQTVDLLAIRGASHEDCVEHSKMFLPLPRRQVLLVSRDRDNNQWKDRFGSFLQPERARPGQERDFTDPVGGLLHLGYRQLLDIFQQSESAIAAKDALNAQLAA
jgi:hypothetical protein